MRQLLSFGFFLLLFPSLMQAQRPAQAPDVPVEK